MNKRHYEHTLPNIRGSLSNTYGHWTEYKATDKTGLRRYLYGRIDNIVELEK